jgi:hypothetical protein
MDADESVDADDTASGCVTIRDLPLDSLPEALFALTVLSGLTELHMNKTLIPTLPPSIVKLTALTKLDLSQNDKLEAVTEHIGEMVGLKVLQLGWTHLQELPSSIGKLTGLEILDLGWCYKLQALPKEIGRMVGLRTLNLGGCDLKELPSSIGNLTSLQTLNLSGNYKLTGGVHLNHSLESVNLGACELTAVQCDRIVTILNDDDSNLRYLNIRHVDAMSQKLFRVAAAMRSNTTLTELHVPHAPRFRMDAATELFDALRGNRSLRRLSLSLGVWNQNIAAQIAKMLGTNRALEEIDFGHDTIKMESLLHIVASVSDAPRRKPLLLRGEYIDHKDLLGIPVEERASVLEYDLGFCGFEIAEKLGMEAMCCDGIMRYIPLLHADILATFKEVSHPKSVESPWFGLPTEMFARIEEWYYTGC